MRGCSVLVDDNTRRAIRKAKKEAQGRVDYWSKALDRAHGRFATPGSKTTLDDLKRTEWHLKQAQEVLANFEIHSKEAGQ